jgi:hypothetical protein
MRDEGGGGSKDEGGRMKDDGGKDEGGRMKDDGGKDEGGRMKDDGAWRVAAERREWTVHGER